MAFSDTQTRALKAKLDSEHVKTRQANGSILHYIEGWHAIAEANRIFGFDAWDRRTLATRCVWTGTDHVYYLAAYTVKVRIRVRASDVVIIREGSGSGEGRALTAGQAHEVALKSAETDATKRALATFGNPFGLALYDREQTGVRRPKGKTALKQTAEGPWLLRSAKGTSLGTFKCAEEFAHALRREMAEVRNIELLFSVWEQNVASVRALSYALKQTSKGKEEFAKELVAHLKSCANALAKPASTLPAQNKIPPSDVPSNAKPRPRIDKSLLAISEPKRHRSKQHLRHVAEQPCLVCGRTPSQAHHIRYAQPRGLALKVSDEFAVPLCAIHHTENHATGDERGWWQTHKIDPLTIARELWEKFNQGITGSAT
jgi:hypothetical protein